MGEAVRRGGRPGLGLTSTLWTSVEPRPFSATRDQANATCCRFHVCARVPCWPSSSVTTWPRSFHLQRPSSRGALQPPPQQMCTTAIVARGSAGRAGLEASSLHTSWPGHLLPGLCRPDSVAGQDPASSPRNTQSFIPDPRVGAPLRLTLGTNAGRGSHTLQRRRRCSQMKRLRFRVMTCRVCQLPTELSLGLYFWPRGWCPCPSRFLTLLRLSGLGDGHPPITTLHLHARIRSRCHRRQGQ
ncbi:uncharacterized protein LOC123627505 isoform X2 [Lemur catta]|uniref:uncharacterized protein LOC123627505 isoform X2 n=1 Tax=Lemur catta TaxID=9447 RepID=UPI001E266B6B|nr:uncharacterized protein LOC123627505 isoform X2 [Lemur catta]